MKICRRMVAIAAAPLAAALVLLAAPGLPVAAADGGRSAAVPATPHLVSTVPSTMATTNDKVNALAYANGVVYAGGFFTRMTFKGVSYVRHHLGAVSSTTGAPTSFHPDINGEVTAIALSPNRKLLYVAGRFTAVGKAVRTDVAAFSTATGKLTSFAPAILAGSLQAIAVTSSGIYLGGTITHVDGKPRTEAAEVTPQGKVTGWAPRLDGWVRALLVSPDKTRIFLGGGFHHVNGVAREALASVNGTGGSARSPRSRRTGRGSSRVPRGPVRMRSTERWHSGPEPGSWSGAIPAGAPRRLSYISAACSTRPATPTTAPPRADSPISSPAGNRTGCWPRTPPPASSWPGEQRLSTSLTRYPIRTAACAAISDPSRSSPTAASFSSAGSSPR